MLKKILNKLNESNKILIASHVNPDGDSIGSELALYEVLSNMGKQVCVVNPNPVPSMYKFLKYSCEIKEKIDKTTDFDIAVVLDSTSFDRLSDLADEVKNIPFIINIDHHVSNTMFGDLNYVKGEFSSVGEVLYELFCLMNIEITHSIAQALYVSIATDTGFFKFSNTSSETLRLAGQLVEKGVDPAYAAREVNCSATLKTYKLLGLALDTLEFDEKYRISSMLVTKEMFCKTQTTFEDTEEFIDFICEFKNLNAAILLKENEEKKNNIKVSLRYSGAVDVNELANKFGGGGHKCAAGLYYEGEIEEFRRMLVEEIRSCL